MRLWWWWSCDGEHHDAAATTRNFFCRNDRPCGLRVHLHAETKTKTEHSRAADAACPRRRGEKRTLIGCSAIYIPDPIRTSAVGARLTSTVAHSPELVGRGQ